MSFCDAQADINRIVLQVVEVESGVDGRLVAEVVGGAVGDVPGDRAGVHCAHIVRLAYGVCGAEQGFKVPVLATRGVVHHDSEGFILGHFEILLACAHAMKAGSGDFDGPGSGHHGERGN